ncbi:MAG: hypothetical protein ACTS73_03600 [Arsenophonus sp. NEOnobi-MAG3]
MINFINYFNIIEIICHVKFTIQVSEKADITCDLFYELIRNAAKQLIPTVVEAKLKGMLRQSC